MNSSPIIKPFKHQQDMELRPHQKKAVDESPNKWCLWFRQRVGKTATAIMLAETRCKSCLIISPKQIKQNWNNEVANWSKGNCKFFIISKEDMRLNKNLPDNIEGIIVDEVHSAFGNYQTKSFKALERYIKLQNCQYIWLLSGTPMTANNFSIYSYGRLLGKDWNWFEWRKTFNFPIKMGNRVIWQPRKDKDAELQTILKRIGTVIDLKDVADIADDEDVFEYFPLNKEQKELIKESFDPLPIVRNLKQHEIESGILLGDGYRKTKYINCAKDKRIIELADQEDKVVIIVKYLELINKYEKLLSSSGKIIFKISGQEKKTATEISAEAEKCDKAIVIIQSDTVMGYSLQSFSLVVFASMSYSFVNYDQVRFRTKNINKSTPCVYVHLLTDGKSIDKAVYDCVSRKQNFSIELYDNTRS